jgi:hypothetical protein
MINTVHDEIVLMVPDSQIVHKTYGSNLLYETKDKQWFSDSGSIYQLVKGEVIPADSEFVTITKMDAKPVLESGVRDMIAQTMEDAFGELIDTVKGKAEARIGNNWEEIK